MGHRQHLSYVCTLLVVALATGSAQADIENWGFETGDFTGWTSVGVENAVLNANAWEGDYWALVKAQSDYPFGPTVSATLSQTYTVESDANVFLLGVFWLSMHPGTGATRSGQLIPTADPGAAVDLLAGTPARDGIWDVYGTDISALRDQEVEVVFEVTAGGGGCSLLAVDGFAIGVSSLPGDVNGDGRIDGADLSVLAGNWQASGGLGLTDGDCNGDGCVNGGDLSLLAANWQFGAGSSAGYPIPEPVSGALLALGAVALVGRRRP